MRFSWDLRHLWGHLDHFCCSLLDEVIWTSRAAAYVENMNPEADDTLEKTHSIQLNTVLTWIMEFCDLTISPPLGFKQK